MTCVIKEISDFEEFLALEREWNELLAESHCDIPFLRHEWLSASSSFHSRSSARNLSISLISLMTQVMRLGR